MHAQVDPSVLSDENEQALFFTYLQGNLSEILGVNTTQIPTSQISITASSRRRRHLSSEVTAVITVVVEPGDEGTLTLATVQVCLGFRA